MWPHPDSRGAIFGACSSKRVSSSETPDWLHIDLYALESVRNVPAAGSAAGKRHAVGCAGGLPGYLGGALWSLVPAARGPAA